MISEEELRQRMKLNLLKKKKRRIPPCFKPGGELVRILRQIFKFRYVCLGTHYFEVYDQRLHYFEAYHQWLCDIIFEKK